MDIIISALLSLLYYQVLPLLKEGGGRLVQVTTTATAHPWPGLSVYTATKAAIEAFR